MIDYDFNRAAIKNLESITDSLARLAKAVESLDATLSQVIGKSDINRKYLRVFDVSPNE